MPTEIRDPRPSKSHSVTLPLQVPGFTYADLYEPRRLADLTEAFREYLGERDVPLRAQYDEYLRTAGAGGSPVEISRLLVEVAGHLGSFLGLLFGISAERDGLIDWTSAQAPIFRFKRDFLVRRVLKKYPAPPEHPAFAVLEKRVSILRDLNTGASSNGLNPELAVAELVVSMMDVERLLQLDPADPEAQGELDWLAQFRTLVAAIQQRITDWPEIRQIPRTTDRPIADADRRAIAAIMPVLEGWAAGAYYRACANGNPEGWISWRLPAKVDYDAGLVPCLPAGCGVAGEWVGPLEHRRRRDGFVLTDRRMAPLPVLNEADYCIYCHERDKDSCSKGLFGKDGAVKTNPLGIELNGCPLNEKISEAHLLKSRGDSLGALALVMVDNPFCPGTGHRICNDCMKSCIYQKQDPVNIPQIETRILTDVLEMPWGVEIYALLTRWNPLNAQRPQALPYNGKNVLVVGMGPAGYTLALHLLNEGFGVVGVDGLKIEPLSTDLTGADGIVPEPVQDIESIRDELNERILSGFGGVSEYGITVRWDKNFLTLIRLALARRRHFRLFGGIRFGGTMTIEDAFDRFGFDHIAIATGAGKPTVVPMKNNLIKGIRMASDFLMALQLTGAFKQDSMANLQVRLPALVVGGGLTAIDTATELMAYYPVQVEKVLQRFEALTAAGGKDRFWQGTSEENALVIREFLEHAREIRRERERAAAAGESPNLAALVQSLGGVRIAYRKGLADSPAYRLNHEEVIKAFEEGISFVEGLSPVEAKRDSHGALRSVVFDQQTKEGGRWRSSGQSVELPARALMVAAGTSPNVIYEREYPGTFELDERGQFFQSYREVFNGSPEPSFVKGTPDDPGFFTSYHRAGRHITFYGDNHPKYAGNVVKAMASTKDGCPHVVRLFAEELKSLDPALADERRDRWRSLTTGLDRALTVRVEIVERLTPTIVEVIVRAPLAAEKFQPGQFYRLQNFETLAPVVDGSRLTMEGIALTGAWVDRANGLLSMIVLEMGVSSRLCAYLKPGEPVITMGPTGTPTTIPVGETVLLAGGGLGNAVLFSIAQKLKQQGNRIIYFAGYRRAADLFRQDDVERWTDAVVWATDTDPAIASRRPQDRSFVGNMVEAMNAYGRGRLGTPTVAFADVDRIIAIGSDRMMNAVRAARHDVLADLLPKQHTAIGSINSTMQCMMKEICAQCLQMHIDPLTGDPTGPVFSCFNQDQPLDRVDFMNLNERLKTNSALEHVSNRWLDHLLSKSSQPHV